MKKLILSLCIALSLFSCSVLKENSKNDQSEIDRSIERRLITRPGDTLTIDIPNVRYKDTTITRVNYENRTVATVRYDSQGNQQFECLSAELREEMHLIREAIKNDIQEETKTESQFSPDHFIYALAFLLFVFVIGMIVLLIIISKLKKTIPDIAMQAIKNMKDQ